MTITDVRVRKITKEGKMKAVVSITLDDEFVVHDIKVIEGEKGLFIAMPSKKSADGEYRDIAHPINSGTREKIQNLILEKYEEYIEQQITSKILEEIYKAKFNILAIYTQPDKPVGRSQILTPPDVKKLAIDLGIQDIVHQPNSLREAGVKEHIKSLNPDYKKKNDTELKQFIKNLIIDRRTYCYTVCLGYVLSRMCHSISKFTVIGK